MKSELEKRKDSVNLRLSMLFFFGLAIFLFGVLFYLSFLFLIIVGSLVMLLAFGLGFYYDKKFKEEEEGV